MKRTIDYVPEHIEEIDNRVLFNWNIKTDDGETNCESVDVAGELTRNNIKYAMMQEFYTQEEINELERARKAIDINEKHLLWKDYKAKKDECNAIISECLGEDFK